MAFCHHFNDLLAAVGIVITVGQRNAAFIDQRFIRGLTCCHGACVVVITTIRYPTVSGDKIGNLRRAADVISLVIHTVCHQLHADICGDIAGVFDVDFALYVVFKLLRHLTGHF